MKLYQYDLAVISFLTVMGWALSIWVVRLHIRLNRLKVALVKVTPSRLPNGRFNSKARTTREG